MTFSQHIFLTILCFSLSPLVLAQVETTSLAAKMDSTKLLIDNHIDEDEELVALMNEYARLCFYKLEYDSGLAYTYKAREISDKLDFDDGLIMYYLTWSVYYYRDGEMAAYYRKKAQWLSKSLEEDLNEFNIYLDLSYDPIEGDLETTIDKLNEHLLTYKKLDELEFQANVFYRISVINYVLGNSDEVIKNLDNEVLFKIFRIC